MSNRRFILGTAGHVDHGKTELVRRLTGWETDRLKEEKERGISIELGFAPLRLDDMTIGIVDVPGHERFVKHMVAGAGGIDMAILVVAADESVMPQTREHLEVLRSLDVKHGVVVITKIDMTSRELIGVVRDDVRELVAGTFLEGAPVVETSAKTGAGFDDLRAVLKDLAERIPPRDVSGPFRLAVDRVFHKQGIGVVVTGSCYSGTVRVGDTLELLPAEKTVRVREVQSFGDVRQAGYAGERLAIALQGGKLSQVERGAMLVAPSTFTVSYMLDARVVIAKYARFELKQRQRIRLHHGAREVLGRVVLLERGPDDTMRSGDEGLVQFRLETPIVAGSGDFFVLRTYSPAHVLGGGHIINASAEKHRPRDARVLEDLSVREAGDPTEQTRKTLRDAGLEGVERKSVDPEVADALIAGSAAIEAGKRLFDAGAIDRLGEDVERLAQEVQQASPLRYGIDKEELRQRLSFPHATPLFNRVLDVVASRRPVFVKENAVRAGTRDVDLPPSLQRSIETLEETIKKAGVSFMAAGDLEGSWREKAKISDALQYLRDAGRIRRIGTLGIIHVDVFDDCVRQVDDWLDEHGEIAVAAFKDLFGITRKHAIPLLEAMDELRYTTRRDDTRVRGPGLKKD